MAIDLRRRARPHRAAAAIDAVAVAAAGAASVIVLLRGSEGLEALGLVLAGTALATWLGVRRGPAPNAVLLWTAIAVVAFVAVAHSPIGSHDLWSYAMYGRVLAVHHANPYVVAPAHYPADPVLPLVGVGWRHTVSAYGPLFVGYAWLAARVSGTHITLLRLAFQGSAALAVLGTIVLAARQTRDRRVVALVGLQPFVWCAVVNGGHNDALVAFAVAVASVFLLRDRPRAAALTLALGALIKLSAILGLPVLVGVLVARRRWRAAWQATAIAAATLALGTAVAPQSLTTAAAATRGIVSRASPWRLLVLPHLVESRATSTLALVAVAACITIVAWRHRTTTDVSEPFALALGCFAILGSYVLAWYVVWALPAAAMARRRSVALLLVLHGGVLYGAYIVGTAAQTERWLGGLLTVVLPIATVVALAVLVLREPVGPRPRPAVPPRVA